MTRLQEIIASLSGPLGVFREPRVPGVSPLDPEQELQPRVAEQDIQPLDSEPDVPVYNPVKALLICAIQAAQAVFPVDWSDQSARKLLQEVVPGTQSAGSIRITRPEYTPDPFTKEYPSCPRDFCPNPPTFIARMEGADTVAVYDLEHPFVIDDGRLADAVWLFMAVELAIDDSALQLLSLHLQGETKCIGELAQLLKTDLLEHVINSACGGFTGDVNLNLFFAFRVRTRAGALALSYNSTTQLHRRPRAMYGTLSACIADAGLLLVSDFK
jgi:hypothetical protein